MTSVLTLPATARATGIVADWLLRSAAPIVLDAADLPKCATSLRRLPMVTPVRLHRPRQLRRHDYLAAKAAATARRRLVALHVGAGQPKNEGAPPPLLYLPDEVVDAAARISGDLADLGVSAAADANVAILNAFPIIGYKHGIAPATAAAHRLTESYCALLIDLWCSEPRAQVRSVGVEF